MPLDLVTPILVTKVASGYHLIGNFETWAVTVANRTVRAALVPDVVVEASAWAEVQRLAFGRLNGRNRPVRVADALRTVPTPFRSHAIRSTTDEAIARLLGVDRCRLKRGVVWKGVTR